jgi:hypothetical protein
MQLRCLYCRLADSPSADSLLGEELFGPILPIIKMNYKEAYATITSMEHPLAIYIFASKQDEIDESKCSLALKPLYELFPNNPQRSFKQQQLRRCHSQRCPYARWCTQCALWRGGRLWLRLVSWKARLPHLFTFKSGCHSTYLVRQSDELPLSSLQHCQRRQGSCEEQDGFQEGRDYGRPEDKESERPQKYFLEGSFVRHFYHRSYRYHQIAYRSI